MGLGTSVLVFIQYCEVLRHVLLHVIMSILCFVHVEMTVVTSENLLSCVGCKHSVISQVI